jgi:hypothetical protein
MKNIKFFNSFISEDLETPSEAPLSLYQPQTRTGETIYTDPSDELKSQLDKINSKLSKNQFFLIEEDLGGEYACRGIYNNLSIFINEIKDIISEREGISSTEIEFEVDELSDAEYILVSYDSSEDMFKYSIVTLNKYYDL